MCRKLMSFLHTSSPPPPPNHGPKAVQWSISGAVDSNPSHSDGNYAMNQEDPWNSSGIEQFSSAPKDLATPLKKRPWQHPVLLEKLRHRTSFWEDVTSCSFSCEFLPDHMNQITNCSVQLMFLILFSVYFLILASHFLFCILIYVRIIFYSYLKSMMYI